MPRCALCDGPLNFLDDLGAERFELDGDSRPTGDDDFGSCVALTGLKAGNPAMLQKFIWVRRQWISKAV
jgi:hypothetical protein